MITYLLIGTLWSMFLEFIVKPQINGHEMNNLTRIWQIGLWPLNICLFIYGYIRGARKDDE